jgi:engulfment/cell motility protein 1
MLLSLLPFSERSEFSVQYALTAMQNLMDLDYGWASLDDAFIFKVVQILSSPNSLTNVCRPATSILKKLVEADPSSAPGPVLAGKGASARPGGVFRYGFSVVYEQMRKEKAFLETVVNRLASADTAMTLNRWENPLRFRARSS